MTAMTFEDRMMLSENSKLWMNEYSDNKLTNIINQKGWNLIQKILNSKEVHEDDNEELNIDEDA